MTELIIRRLCIDLDTPFEADWTGDAFVSAWFNALSMSFPVGEQFFIDAVRAGLARLPAEDRARFDDEVRGFVGQEATHRRVHGLFNARLHQLGLRNTWQLRAVRRIRLLRGADVRHHLAATAALEHFTAMLSEHLLTHPGLLAEAPAPLRLLWLWHASEESEHRNTAFDLYRALGGNERWRRFWMRLVSLQFLVDVLRQTARNLYHGGQLRRWQTWHSGARFLFGRDGVVTCLWRPWRDYFRPDFHPLQQGGHLGVEWLAAHGDVAVPVSRPVSEDKAAAAHGPQEPGRERVQGLAVR